MNGYPWTPPGADLSDDQLRRRAEAYRTQRAWRSLWPWAIVGITLSAWLIIALAFAAGMAVYNWVS